MGKACRETAGPGGTGFSAFAGRLQRMLFIGLCRHLLSRREGMKAGMVLPESLPQERSFYF